jgi:hypothetical protein
VDIILSLAKHSDAYRDHKESNRNIIQRKCDWVTVFDKRHPIFAPSLDRMNYNHKRTTLTILSKIS